MSGRPFRGRSCAALCLSVAVMVLGLLELTRVEVAGLKPRHDRGVEKNGGRGRLTRDLQDAEGDAHVQGYGRPKLIGRMIVGDNHKRAAGPEQANRGYIQAGHDLSGKHGLTFPHLIGNIRGLGVRCFHSCTSTSGCAGYTYHPSEGKCYLKYSIDGIGGNTCGKGPACWFWGRAPGSF